MTVRKGERHWQHCDLGDGRQAKPLKSFTVLLMFGDPMVSLSSVLTRLSEGISHLMGVDGTRVVTVHFLIDCLQQRGKRECGHGLSVRAHAAVRWREHGKLVFGFHS